MSVDYHHRLIVSGPPEDVRALRRQIHREYRRTVGGESWTETVPFSFAALYRLAPCAKRVEPDIPGDPLELSVWRVKSIDRQNAEVRYRFHTRNHEVAPLLRALARALPALMFRLTTGCLDDSSIESYLIAGRGSSKWVLPDRRRDFHWDRARAKFKLAGEDVYEDDEADSWHEEEMLADAVSHWDHFGRVRREGPVPPYEWWNQMIWRDLATERRVLLAEFMEREKAEGAARKKGAPSARKNTRASHRR